MFFVGCGNHDVQSGSESSVDSYVETINERLLAAMPENVAYPIDVDVDESLVILIPNDVDYHSDENDVYSQISVRTGIPTTFLFHPNADYEIFLQTSLVNAQDFPDLIWGMSDNLLKNIDYVDDILVELSVYIEEGAPNYLRWLKEDERLRLDTATNDHKIYSFQVISEQLYGFSAFGPVIRKDLLDQLSCDLPQTYEDWDIILHETRKQVSQPLVLPQEALFTGNYLSSGFGISLAFDGYGNGFYVENHEVKFGMMEDGFSDFVALLNGWYQEGLITSSFTNLPSIGDAEYLIKQANGESTIFFAAYQQISSAIDISEIQDYSITPISDPVMSKGTKNHLSSEPEERSIQTGFSVSIQCANMSAAVRWIDYLYSDEGILVTNYGIEGTSYILEHDKPIYTDVDIRDYTALPLIGVMTPLYIDMKIDSQLHTYSNVWREQSDFTYMLPAGLSYDQEVEGEFVSLLADVTTMAKTEVLRLITGERSVSDITNIRTSLEAAGVNRCIEIIQGSLDAYLNR